MIKKPKIGESCNGCGICCLSQVCKNGAYALGLVDTFGETVKGPCPAIIRTRDDKVICGIISTPNKYLNRPYPAKVLAKNFAMLVGAGNGCDELGVIDDPDEEAKLDTILQRMMEDDEYKRKIKLSLKVIHGIY